MDVTEYPKLKSVTALKNFNLELYYANGEKRVYDFKTNLSHTFYEELSNFDLFKNVKVIDGDIFWPTGQDFCPHTLYEKSVPLLF
jgi:hypothetical protein